MNDVQLDAHLRALCGVDDSVLERLRERVASACAAAPDIERRRSRHRALIVAASVVAAGALVFAWLWTTRGNTPDGDGRRAVAGVDETSPARSTLVFTRDAKLELHPAAYDEPGGLGRFFEASDLGILAQVRSLDEGRVTIDVLEVLFGDDTLLEGSLAETSSTQYACCRELAWEVGERCLMFLVRPPESLRFEVYAGGSGKKPLPLDELFELADVRELITRRTLGGKRAAELVNTHGPAALFSIEWHLHGLEGPGAPISDAEVQSALATWLESWGESTGEYDTAELMRTLDALTPERVASAARTRLVKEYPVSSEGYSGWFTRLRLLEILSRDDDPWATARIRELVDDAENGRTNPLQPGLVYDERRLRAYELLARSDQAGAVRRAWELYHSMPEESKRKSFSFTRSDVARFLLEHDLENARPEVLRVVERQREHGGHIWLDHALLCGPAGVAIVREVLSDPTTLLWHNGSVNAPLKLVRERADAGLLDGLRDVIREGAQATRVGAYEFRHWFDLHLAAGGTIEEIGAATARWLRDPASRDSHEGRRLVLRVEELTGERVLRFKLPTDEELAVAVDLLADRIAND